MVIKKTFPIYKIAQISFCSIFLLVHMLSCAAKQKETDHLSFDTWRVKAKESGGFSPSPIQHNENLEKKEPEFVVKRDLPVNSDKPLPTQKISMKMKDIDVAVLLRALARAAKQNIMLNQKIRGKTNINISMAPWDQVFKSVLATHGLTYVREGDIIRIMTILDMENELKRKAQKRDLKITEPLATQIIRIHYSEAAKLKENLEKFLSRDKDGKALGSVMVDEHTNSLIIHAIQDDIHKIASLIAKLDMPTSQILIEAQIVETSSGTARALGIQWGGLLYGERDDNRAWLGPGGYNLNNDSLFTVTGEETRYLPPSGSAFNFPQDLSPDLGMTLGFLFQNMGHNLLTVQLTALQEQGKLNILSSPSITTIENQTAIIESGSRVPIQIVEDGEVEVRYEDAVLKLEVTPHVINKNTLKLKIITSKDELDFTRTVSGNPTIITKMAETNVVLFNGQTTVIGGLSRELSRKSEEGVPLLKDIPGLGYLFKRKGSGKDMEEVLIFITPHILKTNDQAQPSAESTSKPEDAPTPDTGEEGTSQ